VPPVISSSPAMDRSAVDLPQPDGPTNTMNSPSAMSRLRSFDRLDAARVRFFHLIQDDLCHGGSVTSP
jgi:hypothetical protein